MKRKSPEPDTVTNCQFRCLINTYDPSTHECDMEMMTFVFSDFILMERVYYHLEKSARAVPELPGIPAVILGGLTITRCHWNLPQYASWHGISPQENKLAINYMESTIELLRELLQQDEKFAYTREEICGISIKAEVDERILFIMCPRHVPDV